MTAKAPETHVLQTFEQLLEQCDPEDIPEMVTRLNIKLARHRHTLNSQQSLLLAKLPPELIMDIGERVLGEHSLNSDKRWFRQVLPLLQTCVQLRAQLRPLFSTPLVCKTIVNADQPDRIFDKALKAVAKWKEGRSHRGKVILIIDTLTVGMHGLNLSTAVAHAGALECAIYGSLLCQPAVYVRCVDVFIRDYGVFRHFVSHRREDDMVAKVLQTRKQYSRCVTRKDAVLIWNQARKKGLD